MEKVFTFKNDAGAVIYACLEHIDGLADAYDDINFTYAPKGDTGTDGRSCEHNDCCAVGGQKEHTDHADDFIAEMEERGYWTELRIAQTGTCYVTVSKPILDDDGEVDDCAEIKVRFADHGECYCSEDFSVDPESGVNWEDAVDTAEDYLEDNS